MVSTPSRSSRHLSGQAARLGAIWKRHSSESPAGYRAMDPLSGCGAHGWTVRLNCPVAWRPSASVTFIVKTNVPAVVGVPDSWLPMMAGAFGELSARPRGSWPEATDQVIGVGAAETRKKVSGK